MGTLKIVRGKQASPVKELLYGVEGIGKTTLASQFPNALILDTEEGSKRLDVARVQIKDWRGLTLALRELAVDRQGFDTVVIDSIDWAEKLCKVQTCKDHGKKSIEDWAYGKGFNLLAENFAVLLDACDAVIAAGMHVVLVAHAKVVRTSPPDQTEGYDRWEIDMDKRIAPMVKEWADAVIFLNYRTKVVEGSDGRPKAIGGKERVMFAERCAAFDAKNRFGLPAEMPMGIEPLRVMFDGTAAPAPRPGTGLAAKATAAVEAASTTAELDGLEEKTKAHHDAGRLTTDERNDLLELIADRRLSMSLGSEPATLAEAANANE